METREEQLHRIEVRTKRKPTQCNCERCKSMCHTPCLGTPQDILRLIEAGYADKVAYSEWAVGILLGFTPYVIPMVQIEEKNGWCVFYHDGKCELHDKGLKPTEGILASHDLTPYELKPEHNLTFSVAREWVREENLKIVKEICDKLVIFYNHQTK